MSPKEYHNMIPLDEQNVDMIYSHDVKIYLSEEEFILEFIGAANVPIARIIMNPKKFKLLKNLLNKKYNSIK